MTPELQKLTHDERLTPLMPLIYVAWADGKLTQDETQKIRGHCSSILDEERMKALEPWLDHDNPPSSKELLQLLMTLRKKARDLPNDERVSLGELGYEMARLEYPDEQWVSAGLRRALDELEDTLGYAGPEASRDIIERREDEFEYALDEPPAEFDLARMAELVDGPYHEHKMKIRRELAEDERFQYHYDITKSEHRDHVWTWLEVLAEKGYGDVAYPGVTSEDGDLGHFISTFETLAYFDQSLVVKYGVQFGLWGGSVYFLGSDEQREKWLPRIASAELPGCFAMSELGHGSNVRDLETTATYDAESDEWIIHSPTEAARKEWIGNAARDGRMATVFAQLEVGDDSYGVHAFVVPIRDEHGEPLEGISIADNGDKMGLHGVDNGRIWFDHVRVPRENLLSRYASVDEHGEYTSPIASPSKRFFTMLGTLVGGRIAVASAGNSAAKSAVTIAVRYGARRRQFGPDGAQETPILDYRSHKRRLMPLVAKTYGVSFALQHCVEEYLNKTEETAREVEALAAGLKAYATWHTTDAIQECREACGGQGYLRNNRLPSLKEDTDIFATFEGDNTVLLLLVAKSLLSNFRDQFRDSQVFGMFRYVAERAATAVAELNPVITRQTEPEHLRSTDFWLSALRYRENSLVASVAQRLKRRLDQDMDPFEAFNDVQDHLLSCAMAGVEKVVGEQFAAAVEAAGGEEAKHLEKLASLYGIQTVFDDIGWFLEQGYIAPNKARAIRTELNELCEETREQALHYVDAFQIPDQLLAAPIALGEPSG